MRTKDKLKKILKRPWHDYALIFILIYFVAKCIYFAVRIKFSLPPDEAYHVGLIEQYSHVFLIPKNTANTYQYGLITDKPYLYHFIMGKLLLLNIFHIKNYIYLRLINITFGIFTVFTTYKIAQLITKRKISQLMSAFLISNTLMFTFLSGSVNYDNLLNLISALSIFFSLKFVNKKQLNYLLVLIILLCFGLLTKISFIPLAIIITLVIIFDFFILNFKTVRKEMRELVSELYKKEFVLAVLAIIFIGLSLELYLGNIIRFRKLDPKCDQVLTQEQCMNNPVYVRSLTNEVIENPTNIIGPLKYFPKWYVYMQERSLGILGHQSIIKSVKSLIPYNIAILFAGLIYIKYLRKKDKNLKILLYSFAIIGFYVIVLAYYQNYKSYRNTGQMGLALQGRYIFPVLSIIYCLFLYPFDQYIKKNWQLKIIYAYIFIVFLLGDFVFFLMNVPASWFI